MALGTPSLQPLDLNQAKKEAKLRSGRREKAEEDLKVVEEMAVLSKSRAAVALEHREKKEMAAQALPCCVCREMEKEKSCKNCRKKIEDFESLLEALERGLEEDNWPSVIKAIEEVDLSQNPFKTTIDQLWKFCLTCPSGVEWLSTRMAGKCEGKKLNASWKEEQHRLCRILFKRFPVAISPSIKVRALNPEPGALKNNLSRTRNPKPLISAP